MPTERDSIYGRFEPTPGYREPSDSPFVVVPQTSAFLDLCLTGQIHNPEPAQRFLNEATYPYLARAKRGLEIVSSIRGHQKSIRWLDVVQEYIDPEDREDLEALGYTLVVFVHMPELPSRVLPEGFSKRGNFCPPESAEEFASRIDELRVSVLKISQTNVPNDIFLEGRKPSIARTLAFFKTGSMLDVRVPDSDKERARKEYVAFNELLGDLDINL